MKRKFLLVIVATFLFLSVAISSLAMDNVMNGVRNFVGGTENIVENVGNNIAGGVRNGLNTVGNGAENVVTDVKDGMRDTGNTVAGMATGNNNGNDGYTATRTSTDDVRVAGMTTNTWTWIIVGITGAAIGILVWSYIRQRNKNDIYIDSDDL